MSSMLALGSLAIYLLLVGCGPAPRSGAETEGAAPNPRQPHSTVSARPTSADSVAGRRDTQPRPPRVDPGAPPVRGADARPIPTVGKKQGTLEVSFLDSTLVGMSVPVRGTCLRRGAGVAVGAPPLTRSDWELGDGQAAVWVSGERPSGCSVESGSSVPTTVHALVQLDTLRMFDGTTRIRLYLVAGKEP
jgi:hypothetical protein